MGIKTFNVASLSKVNLVAPKDVGYQDSIDIIYDELQKTRRSFVKIGWYLKHINEEGTYTEGGYSNIYELAQDKFHISQSTATRFMNLCTEFSINHDSPELDERYVDFNVSQLFEMLPMKPEQKEQITPEMTVKKIRQIKRETKSKSLNEPSGSENELTPFKEKSDKNEEQNDDNIPGQTSIEKDFPEYMPNSHSEEKVSDKDEIVDAVYQEVTENELDIDRTRCITGWSKYDSCVCCGYNGVQCCSQCETNCNSRCGWINHPYQQESEEKVVTLEDTQLKEDEAGLREEIEELAEDIRKVFWSWKPAKKIPYEACDEIEAAKRDAIKLVNEIEKLLQIIN